MSRSVEVVLGNCVADEYIAGQSPGSTSKTSGRTVEEAATGSWVLAGDRRSLSHCSCRCNSSELWPPELCSPGCWPGCRKTCRSTTSSRRLRDRRKQSGYTGLVSAIVSHSPINGPIECVCNILHLIDERAKWQMYVQTSLDYSYILYLLFCLSLCFKSFFINLVTNIKDWNSGTWILWWNFNRCNSAQIQMLIQIWQIKIYAQLHINKHTTTTNV